MTAVFKWLALSALALTLAASAQTPAVSDKPGQPVTLVFAGDTTLDDDAGKLIEQGGDPMADFAPLFAQADVRLVNLECVVATGGSAGRKIYTFRAHPRVLPVLKKHLDGVTLANNHSGDFGREAFAEMLGHLQKAGLAQAGGGLNLSQAHAPWIVERRGLRIALLSYNEFLPRSFEALHDAPGVAWSEDEQVVDDIRRARQVHRADLVIPFMHWGWENERVANARQRQLARKMIEAGADAVIGGHPHVTQDIEHHRGKPIVYSVGNFVMKETDNEHQRQGWVLRLEMDKQGVRALDTHVARIDMQGIPKRDPATASPCWTRGDGSVGQCLAGQRR
jgi:poly-gamma-glutamate capsule biosynthesis protein CapA/YwtB (metallophosphatase superfamily)